MPRRQTSLSDAEIIQGILAGGIKRERSTAYLYDVNTGFVYKAISDKKLNIEDAKDAYADAVVAVGEQIAKGKFRGDSKISTFLYRIFSNKCVDVIRKRSSNRIQTTDEMPEISDDTKNMLQHLGLQDEVKFIHQMMDRVGEKCKKILLDWAYYGYSMEEIAERAGLKDANSAISQKYKCFTKLKSLLSDMLQSTT